MQGGSQGKRELVIEAIHRLFDGLALLLHLLVSLVLTRGQLGLAHLGNEIMQARDRPCQSRMVHFVANHPRFDLGVLFLGRVNIQQQGSVGILGHHKPRGLGLCFADQIGHTVHRQGRGAVQDDTHLLKNVVAHRATS